MRYRVSGKAQLKGQTGFLDSRSLEALFDDFPCLHQGGGAKTNGRATARHKVLVPKPLRLLKARINKMLNSFKVVATRNELSISV